MNKETQKRGKLTERIKSLSLELLGYEIDQLELRLMPYIVYVMMNEQKLDPNKIIKEERAIIQKWRDLGYIEGGASGLSITEEFWGILSKIMFAGYVNIEWDRGETA